MIWIFGIIIVAVLIFTISSSSSKVADAQASAEFNDRVDSRVKAYRDFIRRNDTKPEWTQMSDNELDDMISSTVTNYNESYENVTFIPLVGGFVGWLAVSLGIASIIKDDYGVYGFLISVGLGIGIGIVTSKMLSNLIHKNIDRRFLRAGWDISKLRL